MADQKVDHVQRCRTACKNTRTESAYWLMWTCFMSAVFKGPQTRSHKATLQIEMNLMKNKYLTSVQMHGLHSEVCIGLHSACIWTSEWPRDDHNYSSQS